MQKINIILKCIFTGLGVLLLLIVWYAIWLFLHTFLLQQAENWAYPLLLEWGGSALFFAVCGFIMYRQFLSRQQLSVIPLLICLCFGGIYISAIWKAHWLLTACLVLILLGAFWSFHTCYPYVRHIHIMWLTCHLLSMSLCGSYLALLVRNSATSFGFGALLLFLSLITCFKWLYTEYKGF